jgi:hypothetical protein
MIHAWEQKGASFNKIELVDVMWMSYDFLHVNFCFPLSTYHVSITFNLQYKET